MAESANISIGILDGTRFGFWHSHHHYSSLTSGTVFYYKTNKPIKQDIDFPIDHSFGIKELLIAFDITVKVVFE